MVGCIVIPASVRRVRSGVGRNDVASLAQHAVQISETSPNPPGEWVLSVSGRLESPIIAEDATFYIVQIVPTPAFAVTRCMQ